MGKAVLVVDDEKEIRKIIKTYLMQAEMAVLEAADGSEALRIFENENVDLVILDVMMPKMDGWQTCKEIRKSSKVPIIMLTARGEEYDKLFGFELGVDDYVVKPFSPRELLARVKAVFQRIDMFKANEEIYIVEDLKINIKSRVASISEEEMVLTPKEYELLSFFVKNKGIVFSRDKILDEVWGYDFVGDSRTVDTHVKILREKMGKKRSWISTVWGVGYKFEPGEKV